MMFSNSGPVQMRTKSAICTLLGAFVFAAGGVNALGQTGSNHGTAASANGKIIGTMFDSETREPLIGGMVMIDGTALGNVTNDDGYYFITDVPSGVMTIRAEYLGYASISRELEIPVGQTVTVDFGLPSEVVLADAILAVLEREPIPISETMDKSYTMTSEIQLNVPNALPEETCRAPVIVHGSYIINGKWQMQATVGQLVCGNQRIECRPVVVYQPLDGSAPTVVTEATESPTGEPQ